MEREAVSRVAFAVDGGRIATVVLDLGSGAYVQNDPDMRKRRDTRVEEAPVHFGGIPKIVIILTGGTVDHSVWRRGAYCVQNGNLIFRRIAITRVGVQAVRLHRDCD